MSANANANSPAATYDGSDDVSVLTTSSTLVSSSTVLFRAGDIIQPANSRYPYAITSNVLRGSTSTVTVNLHRPIITSENITLGGENVNVGNDCTWRVLVVTLPTYTLIPNKQVQYTGDFEVIEKVI
jgi:hypothetical protein